MVPLPISDLNPRRRTPVVTIAIIVLNIAVWFLELAHGIELWDPLPPWVVIDRDFR